MKKYEKAEKTKGDTAGRRSGIKESNKVGAKEMSVYVERERRMKRQSEGHEVSLGNKEKVPQRRHARRLQRERSGPLQGHTRRGERRANRTPASHDKLRECC